jgi:8-oxo-dGTP pyrophosphatase MutT (NUDIX family)
VAAARSGGEPAGPVPAATVVLLRDGATGLETLMVLRASSLAFAGGMWVFPGGRVDPGDREPARPDDALASARRAAAREAKEEAGLAVDADAMLPFAHWLPPPVAPKRFSTWFFLTRAVDDAAVTVDGGEIHDHRWTRPADAIAARDAGEIELAPPTWITLHRLASYSGVDDALADARAREPDFFVTHIARVEGGLVALWDGDAGYETADAAVPGARHRLWMVEPGWRYERDRRP